MTSEHVKQSEGREEGQQRHLEEDGMSAQTATSNSPLVMVTFWGCSECGQWSLSESWDAAYRIEFLRRKGDPEFTPDEYGDDLGLADRMLCPACKYVHSDDECSFVDESLVPVAAPEEPPR